MDGLPVRIQLGFCGPAECSSEDYGATSRDLARILNKTLSGLVPAGLQPSIQPKDVTFTDVLQAHVEGRSIGPGFILTIAVTLGIVAICVAACTAVRWHDSRQEKSADMKETVWLRVARCCDLGRNYTKLVTTNEESHDMSLKVFDGVRVLAIVWIVVGHSFNTAYIIPQVNPMRPIEMLSEFAMAHLYNSSYTVDVFFFLSGFFLAYIALQQFVRKTFTPMIYLHRLIRLYPVMLLVYFWSVHVVQGFGDGPIFAPRYQQDAVQCSRCWPYIFLFLYSFRPDNFNCIGWVWYLANDFQFFAVTSPLLWLVNRRPKWGLMAIVAVILGSYITQFVLAMQFGLHANSFNMGAKYERIYYQAPWARCPPYFIGVLFGYLYLRHKKEGLFVFTAVKNSRSVQYVCQFVGMLGMFFVVHGLYWVQKYADTLPRIFDLLYLVFSRSMFVVLMTIFLLPSILGAGSSARSILASRTMLVLSKLTYSQYMCHLLIIFYFAFTSCRALVFEYRALAFKACQFIVMGYIMAAGMYLFVELPVFNLEAEFLRSRHSNKVIRDEATRALLDERKPSLKS